MKLSEKKIGDKVRIKGTLISATIVEFVDHNNVVINILDRGIEKVNFDELSVTVRETIAIIVDNQIEKFQSKIVELFSGKYDRLVESIVIGLLGFIIGYTLNTLS